jgi:signal transduction histidine kinase/ActR/RegA family two-component response regulator
MDDGSMIRVETPGALESDDTLDRLTALARRILKAPIALLSTFTPTRQRLTSASGWPEGTPLLFDLSSSLCRFVMQGNAPIVAGSVREHPRLRFVAQTATPAIEAYIGVPIRDAEGVAIGTLCVCDHEPRDWGEDDLAILTELAASSMARIDLRAEVRTRQRAESALRESEARLLAMAHNIPGIMFERRKTGLESARVMVLGSSRQPHSIAPDVLEFDGGPTSTIHPDDRARAREAARRSTAAETDLDLTFRVVDGDGATRWLRSQSVVRRDTDGTAIWDGLCFDISDLVAARDAAESARVAREALLVDVNHELRTPLQAIIGFADFLKTETRPDVVAAHVQSIQGASKALLSIVNQLLDLARDESGAPTVALAPTNVRALASDCLDLVAPLAQAKTIAARLVVDEGFPPFVLADAAKIQQVLVNLVNNAIKYTDSGSITVEVAYREGQARFTVRDTGIGIPLDKTDLLFQRFSRIDPNRRSMRGTGLGLAIAKQLVESMGGTLGVLANPDRGSTFWFELRAEAVSPTSSEITVVTETAAPNEPAARGRARILIADDLDLNRQLIADMLSLEGHQIDCVNDGAAALRAATDTRYDLILMDMIMPVMDGLAATRAIRALPPPACDVAIIALTAHSFKEQLDSCIAAGMNATITKPMSMEALATVVRNWTKGRSRAA